MHVHQKNFLNLLKKIGVSSETSLLFEENIEVQNLKLNSVTKEIHIILKQLVIIDITKIQEVESKVKESSLKITLQWKKQFEWEKELSVIKNYILHFNEKYFEKNKIDKNFYLNSSKNEIEIKLKNNKSEFDQYEEKITLFLLQYGIGINKIKVIFENVKQQEKTEKEKKDLNIFNNTTINEEKKIIEAYKKNKDLEQISGKILTINEKIWMEKQIFEILLETNNSVFIVKWTKKDEKHNTDILKKYKSIIFKGKHDVRKTNVFYADSFEETKPHFKRSDTAEKKRVELHVHTKMSALDGIGEVEEYLAYASFWKHKAIAFTDHENIHVFPECEKVTNKYPNVKIILGCEFEFLSDTAWVMSQKIIEKIQNKKMVFFDLETTGLSANFHNIIEFAAIIVENNLIKNKETFLIKSVEKIPKNVEEITKISQPKYEESAIPFDIAMKKIKKIFENGILIAQNINFDIGFINKAFKKQNLKKIDNPMIDLLNLSRYLDTELRQHNLRKIAKNYKVHYLKSEAHRATYDTKILYKVFDAIINRHNLIYFQDLWKMNDNLVIRRKMFARHVNVLAKNKEGLRSLYHLISHTHTKTLYRKPVLEKKYLEKFKENLLIGSGCYNGEIFNTACFDNQEKLEKTMEFYDYIEIQPLEVYQHLIDKEIIKKSHLQEIINIIIKTAQKLKKIVVASGDVHYLEPEHRIYRDIFVFNKQLGGFYHNLYDHKNRLKKTPLQHFRTTDEMLNSFNFLKEDLAFDVVVNNTNKIADQIEHIKCFDKNFLMPQIINAESDLIKISKQKLLKKYGDALDVELKKRFDQELKQISDAGYSTIYLISYYLTDYSLKKGYLFSSRGSVGSSFLAFCLDITEVNPLNPHYVCDECFYFEWSQDNKVLSGFDLPKKKCPNCQKELKKDGHEIVFESFLGLESETIPDIDLNFSGLFQQEAQKFIFDLLTEKLGKNKVFWTGTVNTIATKSAYGYYKSYLEKKMMKDDASQAEIKKILFYCSGVKKTTGQHPGGLIIVPKERDILDFTPYNFPSNNQNSNNLTTHFDYHVLKNQLLKIDILGHDDPTGLKMLQQMTNVDPKNIDLGDQNIIKLFSNNSILKIKQQNNSFIKKNGVLGLPEFGTRFVSKMLMDINVKSFANLIAVSGLSHGKNVWESNAKNLIQEKKFSINNVISCRDDILLFLIKSGLSKKLAYQIMTKVKKGNPLSNEEETIMSENKIPKWYINSCRKIRYLFPKAHAAAYVIMACRFAWFKIYHPHEFYATYFSIRCAVFDLITILKGSEIIIKKCKELQKRLSNWQNKDNQLSTKEKNLIPIYEIAVEMWKRDIQMVNLNLNLSESKYFIIHWIKEEKVILPPFIAIDGLGIEVAKKIVEERKIKKFSSQEDFKKRTKVNQTVFQKLSEINLFVDLPKSEQNTFDFY